jgi:hypothetical protein
VRLFFSLTLVVVAGAYDHVLLAVDKNEIRSLKGNTQNIQDAFAVSLHIPEDLGLRLI